MSTPKITYQKLNTFPKWRVIVEATLGGYFQIVRIHPGINEKDEVVSISHEVIGPEIGYPSFDQAVQALRELSPIDYKSRIPRKLK